MKSLQRLAVTLLCLAGGARAFGAGFAIDTQSARASGMGGAITALSNDASSTYYNPAGLVQGKGLSAQLGITLIAPSITFTNPSGTATSTLSHLAPPPHAYVAYGITDNLAVGVGFNTPYGASAAWPEDWEGRFRALESNLQVYMLNPTVAYKLHDRFKFGVGMQIARGSVVLARKLGFVDSEGSVTLGGDAWGFGFDLGGQFDLVPEWVVIGGSYRGGVTLPFKGRAHFENVPAEFSTRIYDNALSTELRLPEVGNFAVAFTRKKFRVEVDGHFTAWSSFQELRLDFENDDLDSSLPKRWGNALSLHLGGEADVTDKLQVRLGYTYDPSPQPEDTLTPDLADVTRNKISVGAGYRFGDFRADAAYQLVLLTTTTSTAPAFPGTYSGTAHVFGLTLGYTQ